MIFIVGGCAQGKRAFALSLIQGEQETLRNPAWADGRTDSVEQAMNARFICHVEQYVRRLLEEGTEPEEFVNRLIKERPDAVILADEVGYGIVPVNEFDRNYREVAGRMCQRLAAASKQMYRVVCGIGKRIK